MMTLDQAMKVILLINLSSAAIIIFCLFKIWKRLQPRKRMSKTKKKKPIARAIKKIKDKIHKVTSDEGSFIPSEDAEHIMSKKDFSYYD